MIKPRVRCEVSHVVETDIYGEPVMGPSIKTRCNVVSLVVKSAKTTVRADSSASRGNMDELVSVSKLLFLPKEEVTFGSKVIVNGVTLRAIEVQHRFDVNGKFDHIEAVCEIWA